jgi:hypothetical protein
LVYEFLKKYKNGKGIKLCIKRNASYDVLKEIAIQAIQNSNPNSGTQQLKKLIHQLVDSKNSRVIFDKVFLQDPLEMDSDEDGEIEINVKMDVESKYSFRKRKMNEENSPNKKKKLSEESDEKEENSDKNFWFGLDS